MFRAVVLEPQKSKDKKECKTSQQVKSSQVKFLQGLGTSAKSSRIGEQHILDQWLPESKSLTPLKLHNFRGTLTIPLR